MEAIRLGCGRFGQIFPKFYKENEEWTIVGEQNLDQ